MQDRNRQTGVGGQDSGRKSRNGIVHSSQQSVSLINEYENDGANAFPGQGTALYGTQMEIKRLQRENKDLREELVLQKIPCLPEEKECLRL